MVACEFLISAPGVTHLSTMLIGLVSMSLGFMTHTRASWVSKKEYRLCESTDKVWKETTDVECPDISLETAFLITTVICFTSSLLMYTCVACCLGTSKTSKLIYVIYLSLSSAALIIAGVLYIKSAIMISKLPSPDYVPIIKNMGVVLMAAINNDKPDEMHLVSQSNEETYYQEKLAAGYLTVINGVLHIICAWIAMLEK